MPNNTFAPTPASTPSLHPEGKPSEAKQPNTPRSSRRMVSLVLIVVLILLALVLVIFRDRLNVDALRRSVSYRAISTDDTGQTETFPHGGGDKLSFAFITSGLVQSSVSGSHYYSFTGELQAERVITMDNPTLEASSSAAVVFDAGGDTFSVYRGGEETLTQEGEDITGSILSARVNDSGWLAVTARQSGFRSAVTVYNASGEGVIQISLSSAFAVDAVLSPDCNTVAVVTIGQEGGEFGSSLVFYPVNSTQPRSTVDLGNTTVLDLDYESRRVWVLGEGQLITVTPDGQTVSRWSFGRDFLKGCDFGPEGYALVLLGRYRMGSAQRAVTIGPEGEELGSLSLRGQVLSWGGAGSYCSLLTGPSLTIYNRNLEEYALCEDTGGARYTALTRDGSALLADDQRSWLFIPG